MASAYFQQMLAIIADAGAGGADPGPTDYDPLSLFAEGEIGMLYDPQRIETLWQDTAGTIPVTADGQLVARIDDRSGNGRHLTQATPGNQYRYRTDGVLKWLHSEGRACTYQTAHQLTGPLSYGFAAEVAQSAVAGNLFDTGPSSVTDTNSIYTTWSTSTDEVRITSRGGGVMAQRGLTTPGANRHMAVVARMPASGNDDFTDYSRAGVPDIANSLGTGTTSGGYRLGPTIGGKDVRFYGMFVIQRLITTTERTAVAGYYATLGRLENLFMWVGDAQ